MNTSKTAALPNASACERNRAPILGVLREYFSDRQSVLEIGGGTGQHAVYFARALPRLSWQTSDRAENLSGIRMWLQQAALPNTPAPLAFDVNDVRWPPGGYDALFSANTLHIMSWREVTRLFEGLCALLTDDAVVVIYGPFNYAGRFTSPSNAAFDAALRRQASHMGIRDFEAVDALARDAGLMLAADVSMPANNRCLVWRRR